MIGKDSDYYFNKITLEEIVNIIIEKHRLNKIHKDDLIRTLKTFFGVNITRRTLKAEILDIATNLIKDNPNNLLIFAQESNVLGICKADFQEIFHLSAYKTDKLLKESGIEPEEILYFSCLDFNYSFYKYNIKTVLKLNAAYKEGNYETR